MDEQVEVQSTRGGTYRVTLLPSKDHTPNGGATCRGCSQSIKFARTTRGANIAISQLDNGTWVVHFSVCSKPDSNKKQINA